MATAHKDAEAPKAGGPAALSADFVPNEPSPKTGKDAEGKPDGSLSADQVSRAATEALLSLRPQPAAIEINIVLDALVGKKFTSAADAGAAAVTELNKG